MREAKRLPLGRPDVHGMPPAQAHAVTVAAEWRRCTASTSGMAVAAALVALGGIVGGLAVRNPSRKEEKIHAESCAGGQLVGASSGVVARSTEPSGAAV